MKQQSRQERK